MLPVIVIVVCGAALGAWAGQERRGIDERSALVLIDAYQSERDPRQGFKMSFSPALAKEFGTSQRGKPKASLLIVAGTCGSCSLHSVAPAMIDWTRYERVVAVYQSDDVRESAQLTPRYPRWHVVSDPDRTIAHALNAAWTPRLYVVDPAGRLTRAQGKTESSRDFGVDDAK